MPCCHGGGIELLTWWLSYAVIFSKSPSFCLYNCLVVSGDKIHLHHPPGRFIIMLTFFFVTLFTKGNQCFWSLPCLPQWICHSEETLCHSFTTLRKLSVTPSPHVKLSTGSWVGSISFLCSVNHKDNIGSQVHINQWGMKSILQLLHNHTHTHKTCRFIDHIGKVTPHNRMKAHKASVSGP